MPNTFIRLPMVAAAILAGWLAFTQASDNPLAVWQPPDSPPAGSQPGDVATVHIGYDDDGSLVFLPKGFIHEGTVTYESLNMSQYFATNRKTKVTIVVEVRHPKSRWSSIQYPR